MSNKCPQCDGPHTLSQCPTWRMPTKPTPAMHDAVFPKWTLCPDAMYIDLLAAMGRQPAPPIIEAVELLPCPFCAGAMRVVSTRDWHMFNEGHNVDCILFEDFTPQVPSDDASRKWLVAAWNRRAALPPPIVEPVAIEALELIAAQCSGTVGSTSRADCMAAIAQAAINQLANPDPGPQEHEALAEVHTDEKGTHDGNPNQ